MISDGNITLRKSKKDRKKYKSDLSEIKRPRDKTKQQTELHNIETIYKAKNSVIKFFDDHFTILCQSKFKAIHGKGSP